MEQGRRTGLSAAAFAAAGTHAVAAGCAFFSVAEYLNQSSAEDRARWLLEHLLIWRVTWLAFAAAGLAMIWLVVALRGRIDPRSESTGLRLAVALTVLGAALELVGHAIQLGQVPALLEQIDLEWNHWGPGDITGDSNLAIVGQLEVAHRLAHLLTSGLAPIGFALGVGLTLVAARRAGLGNGPLLLGWLNVVGAAWLVVGTFAAIGWLQTAGGMMTIVTIVLFSLSIPWSGFGRELVVPTAGAQEDLSGQL